MGSYTVGDVVIVPFPYADFSKFKKRPALVVGQAEFNNLILCQITSKADTSALALSINDSNFAQGTLSIKSFIRYDKLFTVESSVLEGVIGSLKKDVIVLVQSKIREIFQ